MEVKIKKLRFKNFLSYGNQWTEINFKPGMTLLIAPNGAGKSALVDAISFALFGKPYRSVRLESVVNSINGKQCVVELEFQSRGENYLLTRGMKPNILSLTKNGVPVELSPYKKTFQSDLEKFLGIDYTLFKNVVCVGSGTSFFTSSLSEKRSTLESIFGMSILAAMEEDISRDRAFLKSSIRVASSAIEEMTSTLDQLRTMNSQLKQRDVNFRREREHRLRELNEYLKSRRDKLAKIEHDLKLCEEKTLTLEEKILSGESLGAKISELKEATWKLNEDLSTKSRILSHSHSPTCPICNRSMKTKKAREWMETNRRAYETAESSLGELQAELEETEKKAEEVRIAKNLSEKVKSKITDLKIAKASTESEIKSVETQISQIDDTLKVDTSALELSNRQIEEKVKEIVDKREELNKLTKQEKINEGLRYLVSDDGIKKLFYSKFIPYLNTLVNQYLTRFNLHLRLKISPDLNAEFYNPKKIEFSSMSRGERTRIEVAFQLSLWELSRKLYNWDSHLLFLDEVFDLGIDVDGMEGFMQALQDIRKKFPHIGIYIISHKISQSAGMSLADQIWRVEKSDGFSRLITGVA